MLKRLYISNFALINEMDVSFPGNLTVITGETGAGKSIFLEALALALGKRADLSTLNNKSKKCVIEAEFESKDLDLGSFFEENELEQEPVLILRREINADGKSRSFLNDSVVSLAALKTLSEKLIDIHSQHQTLLLNQGNFQMELLDAFAGSTDLFKDYKKEWTKYNKLNTKLNTLLEEEAQAKKEQDYIQFLYNELNQLTLKPGVLTALEEESATLENAGAIKQSLLSAANIIHEGDINVLSALSQVKASLQSISKFSNTYAGFYERINTVYIELKELAADLVNAEEDVLFDNQKLEEVNASLDKINRLLNKHAVKTEEELIQANVDIEEKLQQFSSLENEIEKTRKEAGQVSNHCVKLAKELSRLRAAVLPAIETQVKASLANLSMENALFKIDLNTQTEPGAFGYDSVKLLFSANKGGQLEELGKVASGGELSRLMLSLKALLASKKQLPAIIFDEIDTGVSGDVADKIGNILLKMGKTMQVITITHLPQMASKGQHHLYVYKKDDENKTVSFIKQLHEEERVQEIAKMLSTGNPTQSAIKNAKELLALN